MTRVLWTPDGAADLEGIARYLETRTPLHSARIVRTLYATAQSLVQSPRRGHTGRKVGTRELNVSHLPYVVVYRIELDQVQILRILHAAMDRDKR